MFNKDRIYLTINHRGGLEDGFHCSILYALKDEPGKGSGKNTDHLFHVVNQDRRTRTRIPWTYETRMANQYNSDSLIGRILLAKVDTSNRDHVLGLLYQILSQVAVRPNDPKFTCASWAMEAVWRLQREGVITLNAPVDAALWDRVHLVAKDCYRLVLGGNGRRPTVDIAEHGASAIPTYDFRG
ncbi:hypothetical protein NLJ89_g8665 [Agrocybe chaxingu]|uniref:Uncharacterized protein n=1 Tax=Agrocybe chaxingu TaxID=84603 RepID=A0A9W8MSJ6_9AGAR|nr:hypothetical protein NLJ89_g8665 [Agrocybe chaxingu]